MTLDASSSPLVRITQSVRSIPDACAALLIAGVAVAAALVARMAWPFDGLYGQDAFAYFRYARALWPWLLRGEPLPIYYWPAGYPLLVALALPLFGGSSAAGQAVSIGSIAVATGCTFLLCRELLSDAPGGRLAAWVAGLALACCGDALRAGLVTMSDALALACCAAAIWALARYRRTRRGRWLAAAAVALGWATITRWVCGLLALPMLGFLIVDCRLQIAKRKIDVLIAMVIGALIVVPQVLFSQRTPGSLSQHQWVVAWDVTSIWRRDFVTVDGAQHYRLPVGVYYLARMAWPSLLFPLLALLCLPGALWLARRRRWPELALLAGWPILLWLFLSGIPFENARFILPALPALAALAGLGFGWVYELTTDDRRPMTNDRRPTTDKDRGDENRAREQPPTPNSQLPTTRAWARVILVFALAVSLASSLAWGLRDYRHLVVYKNEQLALVEWTRAQLPAGGTLITFGATLTLQHYTDYDVRELFYLAPPDLDRIAQQPQPAYLLLDVGNIESQWVGLRPWQDYHYLLEHPGLEIIGQHGPYTLFRLKPASQ